jgi:tetratricopeptide (TPR) repeat protein
MNRYRTVLEGSLQLAREGNTEAAIHALESILDGPIADDSLDWISLLARNAGVICEQRSEIDRALAFYERGLQFVPDDPMLLLAAGNACAHMGKVELKDDYFGRCANATHESPEILELLRVARGKD